MTLPSATLIEYVVDGRNRRIGKEGVKSFLNCISILQSLPPSPIRIFPELARKFHLRRAGEFIVSHPAIRYTVRVRRRWAQPHKRQNTDVVKKRLAPFLSD